MVLYTRIASFDKTLRYEWLIQSFYALLHNIFTCLYLFFQTDPLTDMLLTNCQLKPQIALLQANAEYSGRVQKINTFNQVDFSCATNSYNLTFLLAWLQTSICWVWRNVGIAIEPATSGSEVFRSTPGPCPTGYMFWHYHLVFLWSSSPPINQYVHRDCDWTPIGVFYFAIFYQCY